LTFANENVSLTGYEIIEIISVSPPPQKKKKRILYKIICI
jgi:hypothetical protein